MDFKVMNKWMIESKPLGFNVLKTPRSLDIDTPWATIE
jgi:hypothetical protein